MALSAEARALKSAHNKKWRSENREHLNAYKREWAKNNRERINEYNDRYWEKKAAQLRSESLKTAHSSEGDAE